MNRMWGLNVGGAIRNRASYAFRFDRNTINNTALIKAVTLDPTTLEEIPVAKTVVVPRSDTSGSARLDYQMTSNNSLTAGYRHWTSHQENNGIGQYSLEARGYSSESSTTEVRFTETAVLSSRTVTETRVGITRNRNHRYGDTATPSLIVSNAFNGGSAQTGRTLNVKTLTEIQNNTTVVHGVHSIRFGGRLGYIPITDISPSNFGGTFSFFGVPDAQITSLEQYRRTLLFQALGYDTARIRTLGGGASQFSITAGNPQVKFSQTELGVYILDDWRARPNLTVNVGVRYENQTNIHDWRDFAPRISLAWSPKGSTGVAPKTVLRAGWGTFYQRFDFTPTQQALRFNGVTEKQYIVTNPDFYPDIPPIASLPAQQSLTTYRLDPHLRTTPWMYTAISIERQLPANTNVSVIYRDQRTTHVLQTVNINAPLPGGVRPFGDAAGNIFQFQSGAIQKAKWLTAQVNSKLNPRVSLTLQYTFMDAHNHGGYTDSGRWELATPSNPYNLNADWARAGWANKHTVNLLGTLPGPFGLQLSPLLIASSGRPYDLTIGSDLNGDTVANDRPAFATDLSRPSVVFTKFGAFDTAPMTGQRIVPRNYLTSTPMWTFNLRVSKTFRFHPEAQGPGRYALSFNVDGDNILNHVNQGGFVGNLSSPLFGQSTAIYLFRDTSNNRRIQFGTQFTF
jgi:hypothetical protein